MIKTTTIQALTEATSLAAADIILVVQSGVTKRTTLGEVTKLASYTYEATLSGDAEIPYTAPAIITICSLDPNGADRIVTPDGDYPDGSIIVINNLGPYLITFNDAASPVFEKTISAGERETFMFDGTNWR
jgi:hypothetical protein